MWDAWARTLDVPIWKLFGASHRRVPVYGSGGWLSYSIDELVDEVVGYKNRGFRAVKIKVGSADPEEDIRRVAKVREAVGNDIDIMIDANQGCDLPQAMYLAEALIPYRIRWFEEPLDHEDFQGYARLRAKTGVSIAMGEREYGTVALRELVSRGAIDLWQPDLIRIGGVEAWRSSAGFAEAHHIPVLPHYYKDYDVPLLCGVAQPYGAESFDWIDGIIDAPMRVEDGWAYPREEPGWGFRFLPDHLETMLSSEG
jgi:L-alanine-DL-glutamate epimerase-like enolase superfamily enzyme